MSTEVTLLQCGKSDEFGNDPTHEYILYMHLGDHWVNVKHLGAYPGWVYKVSIHKDSLLIVISCWIHTRNKTWLGNVWDYSIM